MSEVSTYDLFSNNLHKKVTDVVDLNTSFSLNVSDNKGNHH